MTRGLEKYMSSPAPEVVLKPCPFCGSPARGPHLYQWDRAPGGYWWIECSGEDECCVVKVTESARAVTDRWNRRI